MKIKTKKKMNFLELAQAVIDGEVEKGTYTSVRYGDEVYFGSEILKFENVGQNAVEFSDYFEVETLEEMTEETKIPCEIVTISNFIEVGFTNSYREGRTIEFLRSSPFNKNADLTFVYQQHSDGSIGKLIWSKENGFEDGVLEVSE